MKPHRILLTAAAAMLISPSHADSSPQAWKQPDNAPALGKNKAEGTDNSPRLLAARELVRQGIIKSEQEVNTKAGIKALITAAERNDTDALQLLLDAGADVDAPDEDGFTALVLASQQGHDTCVKLLLDAGADAKAESTSGFTSLMAASSAGNAACVKLLLDAGADANAQAGGEDTALKNASWAGDAACVKLLLDAGADVNAKDKAGFTALKNASRAGHAACVKLLLDAGADVNAKDNDGFPEEYNDGGTALMYASSQGHEACVKLLLDAGADVNAKDKDDKTALMKASVYGHAACVKLLLDAGADANAKDNDDDTALMKANFHGHAACVKLLLDAGAKEYRLGFAEEEQESPDDCTWQSSIATLSARRYAGAYEKQLQQRLLSALQAISAGGDVNAVLPGANGTTALHNACGLGEHDIVKLLLENGADITARTAKGASVRDCVGHDADGKIDKLLKAYGAR